MPTFMITGCFVHWSASSRAVGENEPAEIGQREAVLESLRCHRALSEEFVALGTEDEFVHGRIGVLDFLDQPPGGRDRGQIDGEEVRPVGGGDLARLLD
ncbi:hypothetical protein RKD37_002025 [Streptomyces ambofaciens]